MQCAAREDKSFKSYRESKIWLEEHKEPLTALPPVTDMGILAKTGRSSCIGCFGWAMATGVSQVPAPTSWFATSAATSGMSRT